MESVVRNISFSLRAPRLIRCLSLLAALIGSALWSSTAWAKIEAVKGKEYKLSSRHGPWMIMVTSLWGETPDQEKQAAEAAKELVYQLRRKGIPAYTYSQDDLTEEIDGVDRMGRNTRQKYVARHGMIGVIAGNYESMEGDKAQRTLKYVKRFEPKMKVDVAGKKKPVEVTLALNKAFLTRNPLLPPDQLARKARDPLMLQLNSGHNYSLLENKGRYSLVVSSFYGNSQVKPTEFHKFDERLQSNANISLENAARESELLCATMRQQGLEAYVFHERFRSVVTVGAFQSKNDPEIAKLTKLYQAKYKKDENSGQEFLVAEAIKVPGRTKDDPPAMAWTMDPVPEVIEVPK
jgi:hypothetical protein